MCRDAVDNKASKEAGATHNSIINNGESHHYLFSFYCVWKTRGLSYTFSIYYLI